MGRLEGLMLPKGGAELQASLLEGERSESLKRGGSPGSLPGEGVLNPNNGIDNTGVIAYMKG